MRYWAVLQYLACVIGYFFGLGMPYWGISSVLDMSDWAVLQFRHAYWVFLQLGHALLGMLRHALLGISSVLGTSYWAVLQFWARLIE